MQLINVYLTRHGQSTYQCLKLVPGINEFGLSGLGKIQSKKIGSILSSIKFDQVYTSDVKRCVESYSLIEHQLKHKPINITYTSLLREKDSGNDCMKAYSVVHSLCKKEDAINLDQETQNRVKDFFNQLVRTQLYKKSYGFFTYRQTLGSKNVNTNLNYSLQQYSTSQKGQNDSNILVVSHAGFIGEALAFLYNKQQNMDQLYPQIYAKNGALFLLEFEVMNIDNWKCNVSLKNFQRKLNTPFSSIN